MSDLEEKLVYELKHQFTPMKERVDEELVRIDRVRTIFEQVERNEASLFALEAVLDEPDLDDQKREDARLLLQLSRRAGYDLKAGLLSILAPVKQSCQDDLRLVSEIKAVFENFD